MRLNPFSAAALAARNNALTDEFEALKGEKDIAGTLATKYEIRRETVYKIVKRIQAARAAEEHAKGSAA